jgi:hypothetical protein
VATPPEDRWLSIAETFEFLPVKEQAGRPALDRLSEASRMDRILTGSGSCPSRYRPLGAAQTSRLRGRRWRSAVTSGSADDAGRRTPSASACAVPAVSRWHLRTRSSQGSRPRRHAPARFLHRTQPPSLLLPGSQAGFPRREPSTRHQGQVAPLLRWVRCSPSFEGTRMSVAGRAVLSSGGGRSFNWRCSSSG